MPIFTGTIFRKLKLILGNGVQKPPLLNCSKSNFLLAISFLISSSISLIVSLASAQSLDHKNVTPYIFVSEVGGMVAGFSATSHSKHISSSGLIQVSKEETNGVLHTLMTGHTDTSVFFENLAKDSNLCLQMEKPLTGKKSNMVSEYYPPGTLVAYYYSRGNSAICEYYGKVECTEVVKNLGDRVLDLVAKTRLYSAIPGLYVRAQRICALNLNLIKFDLELERSDPLSYATLNKILENEMALVRVREKNGRAVLTDNIVLKAGNPIHIRIGKCAYLIFPYRYNKS
jgi:hypothetical protein